MMKKKAKTIFWILISLALLGGGAAFYMDQKEKDKALAAREIITATRGTIEDTVMAQGKLEPKDYVDVGAQVSGQITKLYFDIGDMVKIGDLLAEIDPKTYESILEGDNARLDSLNAQLQQQTAQMEFDRLQYERAQKLAKTDAIAQSELEEKEKILKVSQATVAALNAQIKEAQAVLEKDLVNLGYTKIYAPMDGIISDRLAREGQTINANQTTPTIFQIANLDVMTIRAEVAEADVARLKAGTPAVFSTLGAQERKWQGVVRQILPTPQIVNDVVLYNALIDVDNKDGQLMNGMSTQVSFVIARAEDVVILPTRALGAPVKNKDQSAGRAYIITVLTSQGKEEERQIRVGLRTRTQAEIRSGLEEGEKVIVTGESSAATARAGGGMRMMGPRL
ncbi:MAG: efflux RND transporter periplasmic adaptor subunit [Alphaproteobacteria bacterium]|nr:efflux RND transporter periplasmic adaptor subunit [Alphaproteobacteria bacterium]